MTHTSEKHFTDEELELVTRGKADGMYMKAPNGSPTSLDERQWVQVRTRAFKNWFGDWENAPEAASRIVDENGEPLVVHHGTPLRRDQITPERGWQRDGITYIPQKAPFHTFKGGEYSGLIFTSVDAEKARGIAETRAMSIPDDKYGNEQWTEEGYVYDLYVNSRNPFDPKDGQAVKKILQSLGSEIGSPDIRGLLSCGKDIRGWYDIPSQRVCLYLPHARGKADVERTLLHEGVAHYGLRKLAGHKHMDAFLDDIFNGCGEKVRDEILRMAAADRTDIRVATEEYLARMAEAGTDRSLWDRIVTAFRNLLRKLGFCLEIGTRELRGILAASQKNLTGIAEPAVIQTARGDLELSCGYGRAVLRRQGVETDATSLLERMRKAGISPASLGQEDWKAVFNGGIILPGGRKLMAVREPAGYGMRISGVSPGSARESGMEM